MQALTLITHAGVPFVNRRSFKQTDPGCSGSGCTFQATTSDPGKCTGVGGYMSMAEINNIANNNNGNQLYVRTKSYDTTSRCTIMAYGIDCFKDSEIPKLMQYGLLGTVEWSLDLRTSTNYISSYQDDDRLDGTILQVTCTSQANNVFSLMSSLPDGYNLMDVFDWMNSTAPAFKPEWSVNVSCTPFVTSRVYESFLDSFDTQYCHSTMRDLTAQRMNNDIADFVRASKGLFQCQLRFSKNFRAINSCMSRAKGTSFQPSSCMFIGYY